MLKQLPKSIDKRLSENSSSKEVFDETKTLYENPKITVVSTKT